jgi:membrane-bound lytic murein transglycosylase D
MKRLMNLRRTNCNRKQTTPTAASAKALTPLLLAALSLALTGCPGTQSDSIFGGPQSPNATAPTLTKTTQTPQPQTALQQAAPVQQTSDLVADQQHALAVQNLINHAEASYKSGVDNYNANHLDAARQDFDFAVDTMLSANMDLKNDPQLSDEFDRLLSAINSLEMVALRQGNGFSPTLEAAPIDAADEVTFAPDPVLIGKVTAELKTTTSDLPLVINDYVAGWINAFSNKPVLHAHLVSSLKRAGKYKEMIFRILRENGVPQDLIYQAITESGFQPQALNRKSGAAGMWQFMRSNDYLHSNGYFDERFDPEKSTIAYAKYMKYLYGQTGDWYLAMAAYDWGLGRVQHLVSKTGYADYWELYRRGGLPAETKAYIPSVIAAIIMAKNPAQYGLTDLTYDAPVLSDTVTTDYAIDLRLVADVTDSTVQELVALNPALLRLSTPRDLPFDLHIPPGTKDTYTERLKDIPEENRTSWRYHVVKENETLDQIALSLHARPTEIATYNEIKPTQPIEAGDELVVPITAVSTVATGQQRYTVRRADTLVTVADRFGITVEQLRAWNHLSSSRVAPGRSLYVVEPIRLAPATHSARTRRGRTAAHEAQRGSARSVSHSAGKSSAPRSTKKNLHAAATPALSTKKKKSR